MYYKQIDGLRFIAVLMVIFHHIFPFFTTFNIDFGFFGVNLFFVISGFLITEILLMQSLSNNSLLKILKIFFLRRAIRIFPLYFLYIFICYLIVPNETLYLFNWLLTYSINCWIFIHNKLSFWFFTHFWSLSVEEQFYLIWPFIVLLLPLKLFKKSILIIILLSIIFRIYSYFFMANHELFNHVMLPATFDCFGLGALLAYLKNFEKERFNQLFKSKYIIVLLLLLIFLIVGLKIDLLTETLNRFLNAILSFFIIGKIISNQIGKFFNRFLSLNVIRYFGQISYGLYVYHLLVWGTLGKFFDQVWFYVFQNKEQTLTKSFFDFIFVLCLTILISILSYELFEKQLLKLKKYIKYKEKNTPETKKCSSI